MSIYGFTAVSVKDIKPVVTVQLMFKFFIIDSHKLTVNKTILDCFPENKHLKNLEEFLS